jgi:galactonate dehydratase
MKNRRKFLKRSLAAGLTVSAVLPSFGEGLVKAIQNGPKYSNPSDLKITGIETAYMRGTWYPYVCKIDNQPRHRWLW